MNNKSDILGLEELAERFPRQWLAVSIIEREKETGQPLKVRLITKDLDIYSIRSKLTVDDFCSLYTGPIPEVKHVLML